MKKLLICLFACLILLLTVLSACGKSDLPDETVGETDAETEAATTEPPVEMVTLELSDYKLYVPDESPSVVSRAASKLKSELVDRTRGKLGGFTNDFVKDASEIDPNAYEILLGATNRPESAKALETLNGSVGYVVAKYGNKIVINASLDGLLATAVEKFATTYLADCPGDGTMVLPKEFCDFTGDLSVVSFVDDKGKAGIQMTFSDDLDYAKDSNATGSSTDRYDYIVERFYDFRSEVNTYLDVTFKVLTDWNDPDKKMGEVLLGKTNRPESEEFLSSLAINEYGYVVVGNKLVVAGWSDATTELALKLFTSEMKNYLVTSENENGTLVKNITIAEGTRSVKTYDKWDVDIPLYDGGKMTDVLEGLDSCYEIYITETNADEYRAYREKVVAEGYTLLCENEIGSNLYATYYNKSKMVHAYYVDYLSAVRIVSEKRATAVLPKQEDPYTKITETTLTLMDLDYEQDNFGNCFIITLEDGSFIIHDGGAARGNDCDELYKLLTKLNKSPDGKIHIAGWVISHQHQDHFRNMYNLCKKYSHKVELEAVYYNVLPKTYAYNTGNPEWYVQDGKLTELKSLWGTDLVRVHTGQTVQIRNLKMEVLYTCEDLCAERSYIFNDSSLVTRFYIGDQTMTITGDIQATAAKVISKMYKEALKTDIVQMAHHGLGASEELYRLMQPTVVFWPASTSQVNERLNSGAYTSINKYIWQTLKSVKLRLIADGGHKTIPLPLTDLSEKSVTIIQPER